MTLTCPYCITTHTDCDSSPVQFCTACQTFWHQDTEREHPSATSYEKQLLALLSLDVWSRATDAAETVSFDLWHVAHSCESMADLSLDLNSAIRDAKAAVKALEALLGVVTHSALGQKQLQLPEVKS